MTEAATKAPAKKKAVKKAPAKKPVKKAAKAPAINVSGRDAVYTDIEVKLYQGDNALTVEQAKEYLGWMEGPPEGKPETPPFLTDYHSKQVWLAHNDHNRPFDRGLCKTWESEILNKRWRLNGESMIIGRTGICISCQHRLVALVLAAQERDLHPDKWPLWDCEPTMECLIVMGIDESSEVVDTIDTGKRRSLMDVIYRSELFEQMKASDRKQVSQIASYAIKCLADRTGILKDAYAPSRTHSEMIDVLHRHEKLLDAVKHIFEENEGGKIGKVIGAGYAAGLMYLMAAGATDPKQYQTSEFPSESLLDMSLWDKACEFWVLVATNNARIKPMREALNALLMPTPDEEGTATNSERMALVAKAWTAFAARGQVAAEDVVLKYHVDAEDGTRTLIECPTVGGVDVGNVKDTEDQPDAAPEPKPETPKKKVVNNDQPEQKAVKKATKKAGSPSKGPIGVGDTVWVNEPEGGHWSGTVREFKGSPKGVQARMEVAKGFAGAGKDVWTFQTQLQRDQPE